MKVLLADKIGFCFGVKRAVNMAQKALRNNSKICSLGSIIHNKQVVGLLASKGLKVTGSPGDIKSGGYRAVVISSHGIKADVANRIRAKGIKIIDTTCPFVLNAQRIARGLDRQGYTVLIVGDLNHPEVKALVSFAPKGAIVIKDVSQARSLALKKVARVAILSQTTQSVSDFLNVVGTILEKKPKELRIFNTICNDAEQRQRLAKGLAAKVDLMLVVGGRHSANTKRLYEVCKKVLDSTRLIETEDEVERVWFKKVRAVGITSGASTPDWMVKRVANRIKYKIPLRKGLCY